MGKKQSNEYEDIEQEYRSTFDIGEYLRGARRRTAELRLFTDEALGEEIGGYETVNEVNAAGYKIPRVRTWGITGEIIELTSKKEQLEKAEGDNSEEIAQIAKQIASKKRTLTKKAKELEHTAFEVELRAIPTEVEKGCRRKARKDAGIKSKSVTVEEQEAYDELFDAHLLSNIIVSIKRNEDGAVNEGASVQDVQNLKGLLPKSEWAKLLKAMIKLQFENGIGEAAVEDLDF